MKVLKEIISFAIFRIQLVSVVVRDGIDGVRTFPSIGHRMKILGVAITLLEPILFGPSFPQNFFFLQGISGKITIVILR